MAALFADTSSWGNVADPTQPFHALAASVYRAARQHGITVVTTNYVITELIALLTSPLRISRPKAVAFIDALRSSPFVEVVHVDAIVENEAWQLLKNRLDKEWSLVDCVSFTEMQKRGITDALTSDHNFEQAGFVCLLK
jgi:predicted nucleic acid-binding protein